MGQQCNKFCAKFKQPKTIDLVSVDDGELIKDITFKNYTSHADKLFETIEKKYMITRYFQLSDMIQLMTSNMTSTGNEVEVDKKCTICDHGPSIEEVTEHDFMIFIKYKVIENTLVNSVLHDEPEMVQIFEEFIKNLFTMLRKCRITYLKARCEERVRNVNSLRKIYVYPIALLNCSSTNRFKIEFLYHILTCEDDIVRKRNTIEAFFYCLFMTAGTAEIYAYRMTAQHFPEKLHQMTDKEQKEFMDPLEPKDIDRLLGIFIDDFFGDKEELTYDEFNGKFKDDKFTWIFSSSGIRHYLEIHNDGPDRKQTIESQKSNKSEKEEVENNEEEKEVQNTDEN